MVMFDREERELLMLEYKELLNEILQRRQNTWLVHSILLASTFIISFRANPELLPYPYVVSLALVTVSGFLQLTATHVNNSCWKRRHEIEEKLGMKAPIRRLEVLKETWLYKIRSYFWFALWTVLFAIYLLLLLSYYGIELLPFTCTCLCVA